MQVQHVKITLLEPLLTLRWVAGPNRNRATEPLYGIGTALPPETT